MCPKGRENTLRIIGMTVKFTFHGWPCLERKPKKEHISGKRKHIFKARMSPFNRNISDAFSYFIYSIWDQPPNCVTRHTFLQTKFSVREQLFNQLNRVRWLNLFPKLLTGKKIRELLKKKDSQTPLIKG